MRISALEKYGIRCLLALAESGVEGQLSIADIAEQEGISAPYASKLLAILRKAGLVVAVRGRSGGFSIAREPKEINLLDVITALGGPLIDDEHCQKFSGQLDQCVHTGDCLIMQVLGGLACYIADYLASTSLEDIITGNVMSIAKQVSINGQPVGDSSDEIATVSVLNKRIG